MGSNQPLDPSQRKASHKTSFALSPRVTAELREIAELCGMGKTAAIEAGVSLLRHALGSVKPEQAREKIEESRKSRHTAIDITDVGGKM
jgi:hypothetical protein